MIPFKDDNPTPTFPVVTLTLVAVNVLVFFHQLGMPQDELRELVYTYGAVPELIVRGQNLHAVFTSMFLHGGLMHLLGNMLFMWIFADNIEHLTGHGRFIVFYLICGVIAFLTHFFMAPLSQQPMIGASGAISGVLGAYALRFPRARVHVIWILFIFISIDRIPAVIVLGLWFLFQIMNAVVSQGTGGGVAWYAHIGGFIGGFLLIKLFEKRRVVVYYDR